MSIYSEMPCWEIMQCNRKQKCLYADGEKKPCWEQVKKNDAYSSHICVDCLVYMVKHVESSLTDLEKRFIMEQRKNTFERKYGQNLFYSCIGPVARIKDTLKILSPPPL
ncbi:MAG: hypothetical protein K9K37_13090 [Desulfocapsa sp.]|nr:hypothetical protein [Desulfocapsa sp.]